jgi:hypothetical protein
MTAFKWLVRLRIVANLALVAYFMLWDPQKLADALRVEVPVDFAWVRALGIVYAFVTIAYLPSAIAPSRCMPNNLFVLLGPILPIIMFVAIGWSSRGFLWFAAYELLFAIALSITFHREFVADVMSKP